MPGPEAAAEPGPPLATHHQVHKPRTRGVSALAPSAEGTGEAGTQDVDTRLGLLPPLATQKSVNKHILTQSCMFAAPPNLFSYVAGQG